MPALRSAVSMSGASCSPCFIGRSALSSATTSSPSCRATQTYGVAVSKASSTGRGYCVAGPPPSLGRDHLVLLGERLERQHRQGGVDGREPRQLGAGVPGAQVVDRGGGLELDRTGDHGPEHRDELDAPLVAELDGADPDELDLAGLGAGLLAELPDGGLPWRLAL